MHFRILLLFFLLPLMVSSQIFEIIEGDTVNKRDSKGYKQGKWLVFNKTTVQSDGNKNGYLEAVGFFLNNKKNGRWIEYYDNKQIKSEIYYVDGYPKGSAKFYYKNGFLKEKGIWQLDKWVGDYEYYYENGEKAYNFHYDSLGNRVGIQNYFFESGVLMMTGTWNQGQEEGELHVYYEDGSLKAKKVFNQGKLDPAKTLTFEQGKVFEREFVDQILMKRKTVLEAVEVKSDIALGTGYFKLMDDQGRLIKEGEYIDGKLKEGYVLTYSTTTGQLIRKTIYEDFKIVNKIKYD